MSPEYSEHFLIDEQGRLCEALPEVVEALLDYPDADFDITDYAMRNIGWIQISLNQSENRIAAKFRSLTVSFGAISALYALLSDSDWKNIRFDYDLFGWMTETYQDNGKACAALHVIVRSVIEFYYHPPYTSVEKNPALLHEEGAGGSNMLASVLGLWQERSGVLADDLTHRMREIGILPRLMLIGVNSSGSDRPEHSRATRQSLCGAGRRILHDGRPQRRAKILARRCLHRGARARPPQEPIQMSEDTVDERPRGSSPDDYIRADS